MKLNAGDICRSLSLKHAQDVFVPECKNGPTQSHSHLRLDAWAMEKSWAHPRTIGYEIKVSRSDFLKDTKWTGYLELCNEFYFVAPKGLIQTCELPPEAGLIEAVGANASRLITRKKAPYRTLCVPEELYRYILMCRARIGSEDGPTDHVQFWRAWLKQRDESRELGYSVSRAIREHVSKMECRVRELEQRFSTYEDIRRALKALGFGDGDYAFSFDVERRAKAIKQVIPPELDQALANVQHQVHEARSLIARLLREFTNGT